MEPLRKIPSRNNLGTYPKWTHTKDTTMKTQIDVSPRLSDLIINAIKSAGNQTKLAEMVNASRHNLSAWKQGHRACPLEAQIIMGSIAGRDLGEVIRDALIEQNEGTARGEKLKSLLKKGSTVAGAATLLTLSGGDVLASNLPGVLRCILWIF